MDHLAKLRRLQKLVYTILEKEGLELEHFEIALDDDDDDDHHDVVKLKMRITPEAVKDDEDRSFDSVIAGLEDMLDM